MQEIERGGFRSRSFVSVQSALVMFPYYTFGIGTAEGKVAPRMQEGKAIDASD